MATQASAANPRMLAISALAVIVACILLGRWQLERVYRPVDGYSAEPAAVPLENLVPAGVAVPGAAVGRQVTVSGRYAAAAQVIVPGHSLSGQSVSWVVTPLVLPDHEQILIVRGWVGPAAGALAAVTPAAVTVTGRIEAGPVLPGGALALTGDLTPLRSGYLIRTAQEPPDPLSLQPAPATPPSSDAPAEFHLQNAIYVSQWFLLAGIVVLGWWRLRLAGRDPDDAQEVRPMEPVA